MRRVMLAVLLTTSASGVCFAQSAQNLFIIQRSKNRNEVHYDARLLQDGRLDPKKPVIAYWRLLAEDGRREELGFFERRKAYGFSLKPDSSGKLYWMTLVAYRDRAIKVYKNGKGACAELVIDGQPSYLRKLYIATDESGFIPSVKYVELYGVDVKSGKPRREKIVPK